MASSVSDDGFQFQVVRRGKKKRCKNLNVKNPSDSHPPQSQSQSPQDTGVGSLDLSHGHEHGETEVKNFDFANFQRKLSDCMQELFLSSFFSSTFECVRSGLASVHAGPTRGEHSTDRTGSTGPLGVYPTPGTDSGPQGQKTVTQPVHEERHMLSYGIGNFISCPIARYQLALLMALRSRLEIPCSHCFLYDPVFKKNELEFLNKEGFTLITHNEEGKRECPVPTVAFLPHCGKALYNNLLWANMRTPGHESLRNMVLLGNSFSQMLHRTPSRILKKTGNYILKVQPHCQETPLSTTFLHQDVFNDTSVHIFPSLPPWDSLPEPVYDPDDAEIIPKGS